MGWNGWAMRADRQRGRHVTPVPAHSVHAGGGPERGAGGRPPAGAPTVLGVAPGSVPFHTLLERLNARNWIIRAMLERLSERLAAEGWHDPRGGHPRCACAGPERGGEHHDARRGAHTGPGSWAGLGEVSPAERTRRVHRVESVYRIEKPMRPGGRIEFEV